MRRDYQFTTTSSVPQGSHIGPLIFSLYTNDLALPDGVQALMYAYDIKICSAILSPADEYKLQKALAALQRWSALNQWKLNPSKTEFCSFFKHHLLHKTSHMLCGVQLPRATTVKDHGVLFDSKLTFKDHISCLARSLRQQTGQACRFAREVGQPALALKIYNIYLQPRINYASTVWDKDFKQANRSLEQPLHMITRVVLRLPKSHADPRHVPFEARCRELNLYSQDT